jgi:ketosteroid isomerase-like protein
MLPGRNEACTTEKSQNADISYRDQTVKNIALVLFLFCSTAQFAGAQDSGEAGARSNVLALEHAWDQALERGDVRALSAIFDNSLIYVDYDGAVLTKAGYLARVKANTTPIQQIVAEEMNVQLFGSTAVVVGTYRVKGMEKGKLYLRRGRFTDIWVRTSGKWMCVAAASTPIVR